MNILSDKPITNSSNDLLNRKHFSSIIANHLLSPSSNDGLVISINGKWGSGKTSVANMVKECILTQQYSNEDKVIPVIINYSPWNIVTQDQTIRQFLTCLSNHFLYKKVIKVLKSTLNVIDGVATFLPSRAIKSTIKNISSSLKEYIDKVIANPSDLETFKNKVEAHLLQSSLRYIVFIDDLDRLNNNEIKLVIQLVKSICNFSNITYVLLYDKDIVAKAVDEEQCVDGHVYLEKIVQTEYNVPAIRHELIDNIILKDLNELLNGKNSESDNKRITEYFSLGLFKHFTTIREEKRFINNFRFILEKFYKEIDLADLIAITYLRFVDESAYKLIVSYQESLLGLKYYNDNIAATNEKNEFIGLFNKTKFSYSKNEYFLRHLFPYMFAYVGGNSNNLFRKGRMCEIHMFHKYIQMDFDSDDTSLELINNVLNSNNSKVFSQFVNDLKPDQNRHLLMILGDYCSTVKNKDIFAPVLDFLFKDFSSIEYTHNPFSVDKNYYVGSICCSALTNLGLDEAQQLLIESVKKGTDVGALVCLADYIRYTNEDKHFHFSTISKSAKNELFSIIDDKVLHLLDTNIDANVYSFNQVVNHVLLDVPDKLKTLVDKKDSKWLISFVANSVYISKSYSDTIHYHFSYNIDLLNNILKLNDEGIDFLIAKSSSNREIQRLLVYKMQLNGTKPKDNYITGFSTEDIQCYCDKNNISFNASDDYEVSSE